MDFSTLKSFVIPDGIVKKIESNNKVLWEIKRGSLPNEYQEVEYLEGRDGYQMYIDLGFAFDKAAEIYLTQITRNTGPAYVGYQFGATENSGVLRCCLSSPYAEVATFYGSDGATYGTTQVKFNSNDQINEFKIIIKKGHREIINLTTGATSGVVTSQAEYTMTNNLYLFAQNYNGNVRVGNERIICSFKYYDKNGVLICDLIPCYRKSDNVRGMYDLVRKIFLTNQGSGYGYDFATGPLVNVSVKNQVPISIDTDGNIYNNGLGYKDDYRVRSGGAEIENIGYSTCTGYIPFKKGDTLRILPAFTGGNTNNAINFFDEDFNCLGQSTDDSTYYGICTTGTSSGESIYKTKLVDCASALTLTEEHDSRIAYIRVTNNTFRDSLITTGAAMIVTVNEKIF